MNTPRVTVIIPVYNGERYIAEAIESVLAQTELCYLLVVDDGSTDDTLEIAESLWNNEDVESMAPGSGRMMWIRHFDNNHGAAHALNEGIRQAPGEFVAWLSHDDVFAPEKIERQLAAIGRAEACFTDFDIIDADGAHIEHVQVKPPPPADMFRQIITRNIINGSSMLLRRDVFERIGFFREDLRVDVDGEMWLRMIGAGMSFNHLNTPLLKYRRHAGQLSSDKELMRQTKDRVRAEAIERTEPERAFPGNKTTLEWLDSYLPLARTLRAQGLTLAAAAARHKALDIQQNAGAQ